MSGTWMSQSHVGLRGWAGWERWPHWQDLVPDLDCPMDKSHLPESTEADSSQRAAQGFHQPYFRKSSEHLAMEGLLTIPCFTGV